MHEVNLGPALSDAEIDARMEMDVDSEVIEAVLQFIRNEAAQYETEAHDDRAGGKAEASTLKQGAAQGLKSLFFQLVSKRALGMSGPIAAGEEDDDE